MTPSCPDIAAGESYYACPPQGCIDYVARLDDAGYNPGPSNCKPYPDFRDGASPGHAPPRLRQDQHGCPTERAVLRKCRLRSIRAFF
jgi:hypothetical protein